MNNNLDGHLGEGIEVKGTLRFEGSVRIDGKFQGKIVSPASLIVGPSGVVDGEVQVGQVAVHGSLTGQVKAEDKVTIHATGKVQADLDTVKLAIEPGAFFKGRCEMRKPAGGPSVRPTTPAADPGASAASPAKGQAPQAK